MNNITVVNKPVEKKNAVWTFNNLTNAVRVTFPKGETEVYDLSFLVRDVSEVQKLMLMYGFKQFVASNAAAEKAAKDKIKSFNEDYADLKAGHLVMFGEGKLGFSNRERANAAPRTMDKVVLEKLATMTIEDCKSAVNMAKLGFMKFSPELLAEIEKKAQGESTEEAEETQE